MSAPAHVRRPLHATASGVPYGVDIKDANGMLVACVFGLADTMLPTARAMAAGPDLLIELGKAHQIIQHALAVMTPEQKNEWARKNDSAGCDGEGATRFHERIVVIQAGGGGWGSGGAGGSGMQDLPAILREQAP